MPVFDALEEKSEPIGSLEILTDGVYAWPSDLVYYITKYHVRISSKFVEHMQEHRWEVPTLSEDELLALECQLS
jgi:hypothetical protein